MLKPLFLFVFLFSSYSRSFCSFFNKSYEAKSEKIVNFENMTFEELEEEKRDSKLMAFSRVKRELIKRGYISAALFQDKQYKDKVVDIFFFDSKTTHRFVQEPNPNWSTYHAEVKLKQMRKVSKVKITSYDGKRGVMKVLDRKDEEHSFIFDQDKLIYFKL